VGLGPGGDLSQSSFRGEGRLDSSICPGVMLGVERRIAPRLSLVASTGYQWLNDGGAAPDASYALRRLSFGVAPHVKLGTFPYVRTYPAEAEIYVSLPVGLGFASRTPPPRRALDEQVDNGIGWYVGAAAGVTWFDGWWGLLFEAGYRLDRSGERSVFTARDGSIPQVVEQHQYTDHQVVVTAAFLVASPI